MTRDEQLAIIAFLDALRGHALTGLGLHASDPYWNLTLYLMRRHLEGKAVTVTGLASAALVPYASAMRRIDEMLEAGLIFRRQRTETGRSFSVHPTPELITRFEASIKRVKVLVARTFGRNPDDDADGTFYFGGSYMGVRVVASPGAMKPAIGRSKPVRLLCQDDPTFQILGRFQRELQEWLGGRIEIVSTTIDQVLALTLANGEKSVSDYDIVAIDMPWMGDFGAQGLLLPLTELIQRGRVNPTDFQPASWQGAQVDGVQYGIPLQTMPELLFYRADLLDQYRLMPPRSTDALLATARDLTSAVSDRYGVAWCGRRGMPVAHSFVQFMADFGGAPFNLHAENGDFFLAPAAGEPLRPAFDTPAARKAAEFMMALREVSPPNVTDMAWEEGIAAYTGGRVALLYGWSCRASRFELDPHSPARGVTGYLPHPHGPGAATVSPMGGFLVGIPANVEPHRIDLVWRVVEWLASPEAMKLYVQNGSFVSPRFSVSADPEVAQQCQVISAVDRFAKRGEIKLWPRPPLPGMSAILAVLGEEIHDMLLGRRSVAAALERAQARAEAALEGLTPRQRRVRPAPAISGMGKLPL